MKRILIVGYGNLSREDDGIGRQAADELARVLDKLHVKVIGCNQLTPELAESVAESDCVLFLGAVAKGYPGVMSIHRVRPSARSGKSLGSGIAPSTLLGLAVSTGGRTPEAFALTVSGDRFDSGEGLSPAVAEVLPLVVERVKLMVEHECAAGEIHEALKAGGDSAGVISNGSRDTAAPDQDLFPPEPPKATR